MSNVAGFWVRLGARLLDALLIGMVIGTFVFLFQMDTGSRVTQTIESVASILYFVLLPVFVYGYTVAKRLLNIRIVKKDGGNVGFGAMVVREVIGGFIYVMTFGIALVVSAFMVGLRKDKRSLHDFLAGTYVTHDRPEHWE
ncbi:RDD family protein [Salinicoccus hispanicus]|uniref:RDD family protein n=1 Tax=Salinicoccus hispanicus TaxID=157225 RepID=A0A6N8TZR3_9STAP|nr:RDD family protein [Salinicoccus hispanicus]MXQ51043.1 RDD family protein [Salinicoccus hispanicus]